MCISGISGFIGRRWPLGLHLSKGAQAQSPNAPHQKCHNSISLSRAATHSVDGNYVASQKIAKPLQCDLPLFASQKIAKPLQCDLPLQKRAQASQASQVSHVHAPPIGWLPEKVAEHRSANSITAPCASTYISTGADQTRSMVIVLYRRVKWKVVRGKRKVRVREALNCTRKSWPHMRAEIAKLLVVGPNKLPLVSRAKRLIVVFQLL